ncbi:uncharacterized protein LOC134815084 [Bolinopsis microptera]|uniref:uncharacterized protein LOC134815084 n=1 Tax=Bolinopsis microptera TaxID=2820187 RepID=UPI00307AD160
MFWETFSCTKAGGLCKVLSLKNGQYSDLNGTVYAAGSPVQETLELTPNCRTNYEINKVGSFTCKDTTTISCNKKKDSCPKLPLTSHQVSCHVFKETTLYTCTMTCLLDYYIISTNEGTASMTQSQSISCNSVTDTWSHQSTAGDIRWDTCSPSVPASKHSLSVNLTLTGGSCPGNTTQLDSALSTWLKAQDDGAYTCFKDSTCYIGNGSQCKGDGSGVVYSFNLLQSKKVDSNLLISLGTKLVEEAKTGSVKLSTSSNTRVTKTLTSTTATTQHSTSCPVGAQAADSTCVSCGVGLYLDGTACTKCPVGQYSDKAGQVSCKSCSDNLTTLFPGSSSKSDCVYKCTVPELSNGVSVPAVGFFTTNTTLITLNCNSGHNPGYKEPLKYMCNQTYSCYPQCQLPNLATNQSYHDNHLAPGVLVSHLRLFSVSCLGVRDSVTCKAGTVQIPDCKPRVEAVGAEKVKSSTPAEIECNVSAVLQTVNITWFSEGLQIAQGADYYTITESDWNETSYKQSSSLQIGVSKTDKDREFQCKVVGGDLNLSLDLKLDVFDITGKGDRVDAGDTSTLTCTITGSSSILNVTWSRVGDVTLPGDVTTSTGTWSAGTQVATLVQKNAQSNSTFRCGVEDGAGKKHFVNIGLQVIPEVPDKGGSPRGTAPIFYLLFISALLSLM